MNIVLGCHHLKELGGSEQHTYALAKAIKKIGHNVYVILGDKTKTGKMSELMLADLGITVNEIPIGIKIHGAFLSHNTTVNFFLSLKNNRKDLDFPKYVHQIIHGRFNVVEDPCHYDNVKYIAISEEVKSFIEPISRFGEVDLIRNPIDVSRFKFRDSNRKLKNIYSLSQNDNFNLTLKGISDELNLSFESNNKHTNEIIDVQSKIAKADLVISLGRGVYESMCMGKNVLVADNRNYMPIGYMDGLIHEGNFYELIKNNCSGRFSKHEITKEALMFEIDKYDQSNAIINSYLARKNFSSDLIATEYLSLIS